MLFTLVFGLDLLESLQNATHFANVTETEVTNRNTTATPTPTVSIESPTPSSIPSPPVPSVVPPVQTPDPSESVDPAPNNPTPGDSGNSPTQSPNTVPSTPAIPDIPGDTGPGNSDPTSNTTLPPPGPVTAPSTTNPSLGVIIPKLDPAVPVSTVSLPSTAAPLTVEPNSAAQAPNIATDSSVDPFNNSTTLVPTTSGLSGIIPDSKPATTDLTSDSQSSLSAKDASASLDSTVTNSVITQFKSNSNAQHPLTSAIDATSNNPSLITNPNSIIFQQQNSLASIPLITYPKLPSRSDINLLIPDPSRPNGLAGEDLNPAYFFVGLQPHISNALLSKIPHTLPDASLLFFQSNNDKFTQVNSTAYSSISKLDSFSFLTASFVLILGDL